MPESRPYVAGHRLELDGQDAGPLRSVEGGDPYGDVVEESVNGAGPAVGKRIGAIRYTDIALQCALIPSAPLIDWIAATIGRSAPRRGGAIVEQDENYKEISRLTFKNAVIREVEFPAPDAAKKESAYLKIRFAPESTKLQAGSGAQQATASGSIRGASKAAPRVCDFRLKIDGIDASRASQAARLVVRQVLVESVTEGGSVQLAPAGLELPDLVVTLPEAPDWYAWRDAFIVGRTGVERTGTLEYLSPDLRSVVARIEFSGLGIHSLVRERSEEGAERLRRVQASIYCENLSYGPVVAAPQTDSRPFGPPSRVAVGASLAAERPAVRSELARPY